MTTQQTLDEIPDLAPWATRRQRYTIDAGSTSPWYFLTGNESTIVVKPGAGGTMRVEASFSPTSVLKSDNLNGTSNASSVPWSSGAVSTTTAETVRRATAVRFITASQAGIGEIAA